MANLVGDEKVMAAFLKFLKTTGIEEREGTMEKEIKWARKNNQAGKDLLN